MNILFVYFAIFMAIAFQNCECVPVEEDLTLSRKEFVALDKFKRQVRHLLPHDYMHEDIYLIKWLRARNLDVEAAKIMLKKNLDWREENKIDSILNEDFTEWVTTFPFWVDGRDKYDRPVASADIGIWDPRPAVIAGRAQELYRYATSVLEFGSRLIRESQADGRNVTQMTIISNMNGFNLMQHSCLQCIPFYIKFLGLYEDNYPGMMHKIFMINVSPAYDIILRISRSVLSKTTTESWSIHGTSKVHWMKSIREEIDPGQIRPQFGGSKDDIEE